VEEVDEEEPAVDRPFAIVLDVFIEPVCSGCLSACVLSNQPSWCRGSDL